MNQPNDVAFAPNGDIYVSDGYGNDRVVVFDKAGKYIRSWGKLGTGPGEFSQPHSIVLDSKDRVYVADRNNVRIQIFDSKGKFLTEWKNIITPWAIAITKTDEIYVCGSSPMLWSEIPGEPGRLGDASQGSAFHEARYGRTVEAALGDSWRNQLDPLDRGGRGRKYLFRRSAGQAAAKIRARRVRHPLENARLAHHFFALGANLRRDFLGIAALQLRQEQFHRQSSVIALLRELP